MIGRSPLLALVLLSAGGCTPLRTTDPTDAATLPSADAAMLPPLDAPLPDGGGDQRASPPPDADQDQALLVDAPAWDAPAWDAADGRMPPDAPGEAGRPGDARLSSDACTDAGCGEIPVVKASHGLTLCGSNGQPTSTDLTVVGTFSPGTFFEWTYGACGCVISPKTQTITVPNNSGGTYTVRVVDVATGAKSPPSAPVTITVRRC